MEFTQGNLLMAEAEALVNTVNCVGHMGRGIALQFKRAFPANFRAYASACKRGEVVPGAMLVFETGELTGPRLIINFPTKRHWRDRSRIEDIDTGLVALVAEVRRLGVRSLAIPPLGCGLGGLRWSDVRPRIERAFAALPDVRVVVFEPEQTGLTGRVAHPTQIQSGRSSAAPPSMTPGRAVLVGLIESYLAGLMDPVVTLLEIHKLMYFAQEAGQPLRLNFRKALFGPYAENLRHVLHAVEGHFLVGYGDGGDAPSKPLELVQGATESARETLAGEPVTKARFDRVVRLVEGFESPFGMELLASVHWVIVHDGAPMDAVIQALHDWNERKRRFSEEQVRQATRRLLEEGWLSGIA
jgi:O-acetyl-ADP-ribose deacetylase (regulator of RNase III)